MIALGLVSFILFCSGGCFVLIIIGTYLVSTLFSKSKFVIWSSKMAYCLFFSQAPIIPKLSHPGDTRNFDDYPEENWKAAPPLTGKLLDPFNDF